MQVFISYARSDDLLPPGFEKEKGFVTSLENLLKWEFSQFGGPRPTLWRDTHRIEGGDAFKPEILRSLDGSDMLLVILSRNWLDSEWCRRELEVFAKRWERLEGADGAHRRIVWACKQFVPLTRRPALLQDKEGYDFFTRERDAVEGHEQEFFSRGAARDERYWEVTHRLARYLWNQAAEHRDAGDTPAGLDPQGPETPSKAESGNGSAPKANRTVYVAKPAADMREPYQRIVKELEGRNFRVVPRADELIPADESATDFIDGALAEADLSIHLLGESEGFGGIVPLQLLRAGERAQRGPLDDKPFYRVLWAPRVLSDEGGAVSGSRDPLAVVGKFAMQLASDKIDGDSLSKFVDFLIRHVDRTTTPSDDFDRLEADMRVYVYHQRQDFDYARLVKNRLRDRQIDILPTVFAGDAAEIDALHRNHLQECDGVVLVWARAPDSWVYARARELRSWLELGRTREFAVRGLIAAPPPGDEKRDLLDFPPRKEIDITIDLTKFDEPPPEEIDKLIKAVRPAAP